MRLRRTLGDLEHIPIFFVMFLQVEKRLENLIASFHSQGELESLFPRERLSRPVFIGWQKMICRSNETRAKCLANLIRALCTR